MIVGFDAKRIYHNTTGLGNYGRSLMHNLIRWFPQYDYKLFVHHRYFDGSQFKYQRFVERTILSDHYLPDVWRSTDISKDIIDNKIDIFHGISNELPLSIPKNIKQVVTIHDIIFHKFPDYFPLLDRQVFKYKTRKAFEVADTIVAVSENTKNDIIEHFQVDPEKIKIVYPTWGREFELVYTNWFTELLRHKYKIPMQFILFVSALSQRKNLKVILDALEFPENSEYPLVVVSEGGDAMQEMESYIAEREVGQRVYFLKNVPWYELPGIYNMAKCLVYPSLYEGFGLPIIEALRMGVPVIASNTSSMPEAGGPSAIYLPPNDVEAWADSINKVMQDTSTASTMVKEGRTYIEKFSPQAMTVQMVDVYSSLYNR